MSRLPLLAALLSLLAAPALADEGMWTFDAFPAAAVKAKYGATVDKAWLDRVQGSAVRLTSGCSASVVTGQGLVLTNHHCVSDCVQDMSAPGRDYMAEGYAAASRAEERRCPGMQAEILLSIEDVTRRIVAAGAGKTGRAFVQARDAEGAAIEKAACAGKEAVQRCQVIAFYQGGRFSLYTYRKYADVRLVFAPEFKTAFFGGDPDNFNFPRYDLDFSFIRLYDADKPAATPTHLTWSTQAPRPGEVVFVAGNPGSTQRLLTADQLETLRALALPWTLIRLSELRGRLIEFGKQGPEQARIADHVLFGVENSFKAQFGQLQALNSPGFIEARRAADAALKAKAGTAGGDPWAEVAGVQKDYAALFWRNDFLERRGGGGSDLYSYARMLVRGAYERDKPAAERLPEYNDARLPLLEKELLDARPVEAPMEQLYLEFWLSKMRERLTVDAPEVRRILGKDSPEDMAKALAASRLADPALRKALWTGGRAAIDASDDPMIRFVLRTDADARAVRREWEARVSGPTERAQEQIAEARFKTLGASTYPDATFSLRLSYGAVEGWTEGDRKIEPFTRFSGLYQRATGKFPFDLAPRWIAAETKLDPGTVFDISSSNDIIGGNSGSPLIDARGRVVGAIFDGNIHSLGGAYGYDPALNRAVSASTAAVTEALLKVYGQPGLVRELTAP
jgi:hypothetical protein